MRAYVTSIGERTMELCEWSLKRNGFDVTLLKSDSNLWSKLKDIYNQADEDFVRIDADVVVNRSFTPESLNLYQGDVWWWQFQCFDWFKQDLGYGGVQYIREQAIPHLRDNVDKFIDAERPETELSRIKEFYEPRRFESVETVAGLNNYRNDMKRVMKTKSNRGQLNDFDWELAEKLNEL